jgi:hypothetical protein
VNIGPVDEFAEVGPAGAHRSVEHRANCLSVRGVGTTHLDGAHPDTVTGTQGRATIPSRWNRCAAGRQIMA